MSKLEKPLQKREALEWLKNQPEGTLLRSCDENGEVEPGIAKYALKRCMPFGVAPLQNMALCEALPIDMLDVPGDTYFTTT